MSDQRQLIYQAKSLPASEATRWQLAKFNEDQVWQIMPSIYLDPRHAELCTVCQAVCTAR